MSFGLLEKINDIPEGLIYEEDFNKDDYMIAKVVHNNKTEGFIKLDDQGKKTIKTMNQNTRFEPLVPSKNIERFLILIFGASGKGKTIIEKEFAKQWYELNRGNIFYICSTPIDDDRSMSEIKDLVTQIDIGQVYNDKLSKDQLREMIRDGFSNSLILFDDNDMAKDSKKIIAFRNLIVEVGRKYHISAIIVSHILCDGHNTKMLLRELSLFVCFKSSIVKNRLLTEYYGFDDIFLRDIKDNTKSFACFNFIYEKVITPYFIKSFDLDK